MTPKEHVVGRLVTTMSEYLSPSTAFVATLGGRGLEAKVWNRLGIQPDKGWLVERSARRMQNLMPNSLGYHLLQGNLTRFPQVFRSSYGPKAGLDLFHWDLCGTVEPAIEEICGVLPLLAQSRGRSLGVTVADQRLNRAVHSFIFTQDICRLFFGDDWEALRGTLQDIYIQESSSRIIEIEKAVLREAGTLMYLTLAFATVGKHRTGFRNTNELHPLKAFLDLWERHAGLEEFERLFSEVWFIAPPNRLERYCYASGANGFRMRTYYFRIEIPRDWLPLNLVARRLAAMVENAPSYAVEGDSFRQIWPKPRLTAPAFVQGQAENTNNVGGESAIMKTIDQIRADFAPVLALPLPGIREGFEDLCLMAALGIKAQSRIDTANKLLAHVSAALNGGTPAVPAQETGEPIASAPVAYVSPTEIKRRAEVVEMDKIRLEFLEAHYEGGKPGLEKKMKEVAKRLGIKEYKHKLGAHWARSQGSFRGEFIVRVLTAELTNIDNLATHYRVEVSVLKQEALDNGFKGTF